MQRTLLVSAACGLFFAPAAMAQAQFHFVSGLGTAVDTGPGGQQVLLSSGGIWDPITDIVSDQPGAIDAVGLSAGGSFSAGNIDDGTNAGPARWDGTQWVYLGFLSGATVGCGGDSGTAYDISTDGSTVVGLGWNNCAADAFRWTTTTNVMTVLPGAGTESSRANCTNADGSWVGGWDRGNFSNNRPARWNASGAITVLSTMTGEVLDFTPDGSLAVGNLGASAVTWNAAGSVTMLPILSGYAGSSSYAQAVDAAGQTIVGQAGSPPFAAPNAFYYRADVGTVDLRTLANELDAGIDVNNITLASATAISNDGNTIVGSVQGLVFATDAFHLELPAAWLRTGGVDSVSLSSGGSQPLTINAGPEQAGNFYLVLGSASGTTPGLPTTAGTLPLNFDNYLTFLLGHTNSIVANSFGALDSVGAASATLNIPAGSPASAAGVTLNHAYVVISITPSSLNVEEVSNPKAVTLNP